MMRNIFNHGAARGAVKGSWTGAIPYYRYALNLITLTAFLHLLWVAYNLGYSDGVDTASLHSISGVDGIYSLNVRIGVALLVAVIALYLRRVISLFVSAVALGYVGAEYAMWYLDSIRALKMLGMESWADFQDPTFPYVGPFRGATWWNIAVLAAVSILFIWQLTILVKLRRFLYKNN